MKLEVGLFDEDKNEDGVSLASIGESLEEGYTTPLGYRVPERRFMLGASNKSNEWQKLVKDKILKEGLDFDQESCFNELSDKVVSDIKESIDNGDWDKLSDWTIAERRERGNESTKPLRDTETMYKAIKGIVDA